MCEPFVATMKALFPDSVHEVIASGRFTTEQRKRSYFASPEFDLTDLAELDRGVRASGNVTSGVIQTLPST